MNLAQIKERIRALAAGEVTAAGSHWDASYDAFMLGDWINEGKGIIETAARFPFLKRESGIPTFYTMLAANAVTGATTIDVAMCPANLYVGDLIYVINDGTYYGHTITAINYTTKKLTIIPPLAADLDDKDPVAKFDYAIPYDARTVSSMYDRTSLKPLKEKTAQEYDEEYMLGRAAGPPNIYCIYSNYSLSETGLTADATTSATTIFDTGLSGKVDDYYNGWIVNHSSGTARVTDSSTTAGSVALSLEGAGISGMASGQGYTVKCDLPKLKIFPIPDALYDIGFTYYARMPDLEDAKDSPQFGPDGDKYHQLLVLFGAGRALQESGDPAAGQFLQEFYQRLTAMTQDLLFRGRSKGRSTFRLKR